MQWMCYTYNYQKIWWCFVNYLAWVITECENCGPVVLSITHKHHVDNTENGEYVVLSTSHKQHSDVLYWMWSPKSWISKAWRIQICVELILLLMRSTVLYCDILFGQHGIRQAYTTGVVLNIHTMVLSGVGMCKNYWGSQVQQLPPLNMHVYESELLYVHWNSILFNMLQCQLLTKLTVQHIHCISV